MAMVSTPALSRTTLVPPVEMISQPSFLSSWANSTMPALSETLISARLVICSPYVILYLLLDQLQPSVYYFFYTPTLEPSRSQYASHSHLSLLFYPTQ